MNGSNDVTATSRVHTARDRMDVTGFRPQHSAPCGCLSCRYRNRTCKQGARNSSPPARSTGGATPKACVLGSDFSITSEVYQNHRHLERGPRIHASEHRNGIDPPQIVAKQPRCNRDLNHSADNVFLKTALRFIDGLRVRAIKGSSVPSRGLNRPRHSGEQRLPRPGLVAQPAIQNSDPEAGNGEPGSHTRHWGQ